MQILKAVDCMDCVQAEAAAGAKRARLGKGPGLAGEEPQQDAEDEADDVSGRGHKRKQPQMFDTVPHEEPDEEVSIGLNVLKGFCKLQKMPVGCETNQLGAGSIACCFIP